MWYCQRHGGALEGTRLEELDPDGSITRNVPAERVLGCVAEPASTVTEPRCIRNIEGNRFSVRELDGQPSERAARIVDLFKHGGFKSLLLDDIAAELWPKARGALAFNPIRALTRATMVETCRLPPTRQLAVDMMTEAQAIAAKRGITFPVPVEKRFAGTEAVGAHKTSMLQDVETSRTLEMAVVIASVARPGRLTQTHCHAIDAVDACIKLLDQGSQLANQGDSVDEKGQVHHLLTQSQRHG